jgi:putative ABC transport system substrate-binding protein
MTVAHRRANKGARQLTVNGSKQTAMSRKTIIVVWLVALAFAPFRLAEAQQPKKVPLIGFLGVVPASAAGGRIEAFRQGMRELGYVEGKNIVIEYRHAEGKLERMPALAAELVRLKVDVIVAAGPTSTRPAKEATVTIPIVMVQDNDPVGNGFVASLAHPGGNITGLSSLAPEISGKQLELLKEIVPRLSRVAVFRTSTTPGTAQALKEIELAAGAFEVKLQYLNVLDPKDLETVFEPQARGVLTQSWCWGVPSPLPNEHRLQTSRQRTASRQSIRRATTWTLVDSCFTG